MKEGSNFEDIFARLRQILQRQARSLTVSADAPNYYCLSLEFSPKFGKGFPVAWVTIGKRYVSYHFMPVYMIPKLREDLSEKLRARMQGKSCFNFMTVDESLFEELEQFTAKGFAASVKAEIIAGSGKGRSSGKKLARHHSK